jgi:hypothetical protein
VTVNVSFSHHWLLLLSPFDKWQGTDLIGMRILMKVKEKCTTTFPLPGPGSSLEVMTRFLF